MGGNDDELDDYIILIRFIVRDQGNEDGGAIWLIIAVGNNQSNTTHRNGNTNDEQPWETS